MPQYNWNIVESGIKHHNPNSNPVISSQIWFIYTIYMVVYNIPYYNDISIIILYKNKEAHCRQLTSDHTLILSTYHPSVNWNNYICFIILL